MKMKHLIHSTKGTAVLEFALVLPLLLVLTFGLIEFGLLMYNQQVITNASREGARAGIVQNVPHVSASAITAIVNNYATNYVVGFPKHVPAVTVSSICAQFSDDLAVTVNYQHTFLVIGKLIPGLGASRTLTAHSVMKCE